MIDIVAKKAELKEKKEKVEKEAVVSKGKLIPEVNIGMVGH